MKRQCVHILYCTYCNKRFSNIIYLIKFADDLKMKNKNLNEIYISESMLCTIDVVHDNQTKELQNKPQSFF